MLTEIAVKVKVCGSCKRELPALAFARNKCTPTGLQAYCRECAAVANREYRTSLTGKARRREYDARPKVKGRRTAHRKGYYLANRERIQAKAAAYQQTPKAKVAARKKARKARRTPKGRRQAQAREAVRRALRRQQLVRPSVCQRCGAVRDVHGHHYLGYAPARHLDVQWLCPECHRHTQAAG